MLHNALKGILSMSEAMKSLNAALALVLELSVLVALGYWGFHAGPGLLARIGLGIGLPLVAILVWGLWGAPKSKWRLHGLWFLLLRIVFFSSAVVALCFAGQYTVGVIFALLTVLFLGLVYTLGNPAWAKDPKNQ
jgi:hypothetical protein